ncbi:hypothetical protein HO483_10255 [Streptococcus suis]|uniref:hypothetical protein n=1 Tax=Streptococcus parasuis TaxID=1501662 RepID=UPI001556268E|nr:hypothetical protein [Streptococcus suis]WNF86547.1 hypothetical protein RJW51_00105 [Streptococcus parasuis]
MTYVLNVNNLYEGCYLASISCAVMSAKFPELSFEHSWDGMNYSVQDGFGTRGTVTFKNDFCIGVFRKDNSDRLIQSYPYTHYFKNCPDEIFQLAVEETLQYFLDNNNGVVLPVITACFWNNENILESNDNWDDVFSNGGDILIPQLSAFEIGLEHWKNYYEMDSAELNLVVRLLKERISNLEQDVRIVNDGEVLTRYGLEGFNEAKHLLESMRIYVD